MLPGAFATVKIAPSIVQRSAGGRLCVALMHCCVACLRSAFHYPSGNNLPSVPWLVHKRPNGGNSQRRDSLVLLARSHSGELRWGFSSRALGRPGSGAMTCAWVLAARRTAPLEAQTVVLKPRMLSLGIVRGVASVAIPLGCIAMLLWSAVPGLAHHEVAHELAVSNWAVIAQTWAGLGLLVLIYWYGFKLGLVIPLAAYFGLMIYQGNFRFRLVIPLILLAQVYFDRRRRRWPTLTGVALLLTFGCLFSTPSWASRSYYGSKWRTPFAAIIRMR